MQTSEAAFLKRQVNLTKLLIEVIFTDKEPRLLLRQLREFELDPGERPYLLYSNLIKEPSSPALSISFQRHELPAVRARITPLDQSSSSRADR